MSQYKKELINILKAKANGDNFDLKEIENKLSEVGHNVNRTTLIAAFRNINNELVPEGLFLKRESSLGRGNVAEYSVIDIEGERV